MKKEFKIPANGKANEKNVILYGNYRITLLTNQLIRIEYSRQKCYCDRPSQVVWFRDFPSVSVAYIKKEEELVLQTKNLKIRCTNGGTEQEDLEIIASQDNECRWEPWHPGQMAETLKGTIRTLDDVDGTTELQEGLLSRKGYSILDDSASYVINENGELSARDGEEKDLYFFGYGFQYKQCIKDFFRLTGKVPMLPRYAFGNWWSRFHRYTDEEYLKLMQEFEKREIPLTVAMIDMDWHLTDIPREYGGGWTGYTWNRNLFPDPQRFLSELHEKGMHTALNVHPADGVRAFEEPYEEMVNAVGEILGINALEKEGIPFEPTKPEFMEAYFTYLHEPQEKQGVDFWWIDWQQGETTRLPGLDPLWILNHYHYLYAEKGSSRGLLLSRYAGPGSHRYPVGFSGDTHITWESLQFQPYFTATASNIGYGWWSHDMGGHMQGYYDEELQVRWIQWGVFSPINRMHSSASPFTHKEPWNYSPQTSQIIKKYLRLRHKMIPYLYTMNMLANREGEMLLRPLYYEYPKWEEAYCYPNEYFFGTEMICLPITTPLLEGVQRARADGWLPEGNYVDWQSGWIYQGGRKISFYRDLEHMVILLKGGAIVVCDGCRKGNCVDNPESLHISVTAGEDGTFTLYEDDGESLAYRDGECAYTEFRLDYHKKSEFCILPVSGEKALVPEEREYEIHFLGFERPEQIEWIEEEMRTLLPVERGTRQNELVVRFRHSSSKKATLRFTDGMRLAQNDLVRACFEILDKAKMPYNRKEEIYDMIRNSRREELLMLLKQKMTEEELRNALLEVVTAQKI